MLLLQAELHKIRYFRSKDVQVKVPFFADWIQIWGLTGGPSLHFKQVCKTGVDFTGANLIFGRSSFLRYRLTWIYANTDMVNQQRLIWSTTSLYRMELICKQTSRSQTSIKYLKDNVPSLQAASIVKGISDGPFHFFELVHTFVGQFLSWTIFKNAR